MQRTVDAASRTGIELRGEHRAQSIEDRDPQTVEESLLDHEQDIAIPEPSDSQVAANAAYPPIATDQQEVKTTYTDLVGKIRRAAKRRRSDTAGLIQDVKSLKNGVAEIMSLQTSMNEKMVLLEQMRDIVTVLATYTNYDGNGDESSQGKDGDPVHIFNRQARDREHYLAAVPKGYYELPPKHDEASSQGGGHLVPLRVPPLRQRKEDESIYPKFPEVEGTFEITW